jgi:hypothetical protein
VYLELPAVKLMYALLTGTLNNQGGATLPATWHMGVDPAYVQLADFTGKLDLYDPADDTKGFPVRFEDLKKQDGKAFLEKELALLSAPSCRSTRAARSGCARWPRCSPARRTRSSWTSRTSRATPSSSTTSRACTTSCRSRGTGSRSFRISRASTSCSTTNSATVHGKADPLKFEFRGLHGSIHSVDQPLEALRRAARSLHGAAARISVDVVPSLNGLEIGDVVRVKLDKVRDFVANGPLDRSFEIQNIKIDWVTGGMSLELFASSPRRRPRSRPRRTPRRSPTPGTRRRARTSRPC